MYFNICDLNLSSHNTMYFYSRFLRFQNYFPPKQSETVRIVTLLHIYNYVQKKKTSLFYAKINTVQIDQNESEETEFF